MSGKAAIGNSRSIKVDYLTRVEGEGSIHVKLKGDQVQDVQLGIFERSGSWRGTAAQPTAAGSCRRTPCGNCCPASGAAPLARPPGDRRAANLGPPLAHSVDSRMLRGDPQLPLPLGFICDGVKPQVVAQALLFLAAPLFRHWRAPRG